MKILVIEDQPDIRATLRDLLEINGHEVLEAEDGVQGVQRAAEKPDFIFCDVTMPNLDGHGVLTALKQMPEIGDIPFVFLTANADRKDQRAGMSLGADDYITKPFTEADIVGAIQARTGRQQGAREKIRALSEQQRHEANAQWSHELLTPLNAVMGMLDLIELDAETIRPAELKEMLATIREGAERQERLARKLINHFGLERTLAKPPADRGRGAADRAVQQGAAAAVKGTGRAADLTVAVEPGTVGLREEMLGTAVAEIVGNAFSFSKAGTPVRVTGRAQAGRYLVEVTDEGPGLTEEPRAAVGAFVQFDRQRRDQQGLGLGLAIARSTAKLAGGSLSLNPGPGGLGLKVTFDLPLAAN